MQSLRARPGRAVTTALVLGVAHALVDTVSVAILYHEVAVRRMPDAEIVRLIILYNCIAFGLQLPLGWLSDRHRRYRHAAVAGLMCTIGAIFAHAMHPHLAAACVGIGNALFHVGAGAMVLRESRGRAAPAGIFVAPGAFGVWLGIRVGLRGFGDPGLYIAGLLGAVIFVALHRAGETAVIQPCSARVRIVLLLLVSVALRSFLGGAINGAWGGTGTAMLIAVAAVFGKMLGGLVADRVGWRITAVTALVLLAPMIVPAAGQPILAIGSSCLVQMTMAVTLLAVYLAVPARPGVAFGLPSLLILLGALPGLTGHVPADSRAWLPLIALVSAALLLGGLTPGRREPGGVPRELPIGGLSVHVPGTRGGG